MSCNSIWKTSDYRSCCVKNIPKSSAHSPPLFRDEDNLSAGQLDNTLKTALENSRHLIVICTENSATPGKSGRHYVNEEVSHFISSAPKINPQHIIPIVFRNSRRVETTNCLPPLLSVLNILAIDVLTKGKERAFNDVVAAMLQLDPRELWEYSHIPSVASTPKKDIHSHPVLHQRALTTNLNNPFKALWLACSNLLQYGTRASRKEYWMGTLGLIIVDCIILFPCFYLVPNLKNTDGAQTAISILTIFITLICSLNIVLHLSMTCRRLHDINTSGWVQLIHLVAFPVSSLLLALICCLNSTPTENKYGPPSTGSI